MEEKEFDYMNVIPLVDVMLVLLTIILTTSTFASRGAIPIDLPRASKSTKEVLKVQFIDIDKQGGIYLNSSPVSIKDLPLALNPFDKNTPFLIRADKVITVQLFIDVMDTMKKNNFHKVSLQTEDK